jgi:hypothetical protein
MKQIKELMLMLIVVLFLTLQAVSFQIEQVPQSNKESETASVIAPLLIRKYSSGKGTIFFGLFVNKTIYNFESYYACSRVCR